MLSALRKHLAFDAAWLALAEADGYGSLASTDLAPSVVEYLSGPKTAHDIDATGTNRLRWPLSVSDLAYPASDVPTWAECLIPAGLHEGLSVVLFEPGGRRVGFLTLLFTDERPPSAVARRRLAELVPILAQAIDPMRSVTAASHLVAGAFAGVLLIRGSTAPLPGLPGHELLALRSALVETVRARLIDGETHLSFLWPSDSDGHRNEHVRVTYLGIPDTPLPDLHGVVLLSQPGALHGLTSRELEVLGMLVDGCSNQRIAELMVVTPRTVATHVEHILLKLGSPSRTHAAVRAQREGLYVPAARRPEAR